MTYLPSEDPSKILGTRCQLPSQFAYLVPKILQFLEERAFGEKVNLEDPVILKAIGSNVSQYVVVQTFVKALRAIIIEKQIPKLEGPPRTFSNGTVRLFQTNVSGFKMHIQPCSVCQ